MTPEEEIKLLRAALDTIANNVLVASCPVMNCEGCREDMRQAQHIARLALEGKDWFP